MSFNVVRRHRRLLDQGKKNLLRHKCFNLHIFFKLTHVTNCGIMRKDGVKKRGNNQSTYDTA